jgi:hypothetical protein
VPWQASPTGPEHAILPGRGLAEPAQAAVEVRLAALVVAVAAFNTWNRLNVMSRRIAGECTAQRAS